MATYQAGGASFSTRQAKQGIHERRCLCTFTIGTDNSATLANGDVLQMCKIPAGARIVDLKLYVTDMDTNGTPTLLLDVGDGDDVDRFIDGTNIGQAGGNTSIGNGISAANIFANPVFKTYTVEDTIDVLLATGPATAATSGFIMLDVTYTFDNV